MSVSTISKLGKSKLVLISTIAVTSAFVLLTACGGGTTSATPDPVVTTPGGPSADALRTAGLVGKQLWANNCASCHGGDTGRGANPTKTLNAIASNTGGMGILKGIISADNASNIATYAANPGVN
jgi:mono/diheme cytochrome c family protein